MRLCKTICSVFFIVVTVSACKKSGCFQNSGSNVSVRLPLQAFSQLILNDNINLILKQDSLQEATIDAPEHLQPNIIFAIADGVLSISNSTDCRWLMDPQKKILVTLSISDLKKIDYRGSGNISNTGVLKLDALQIESNTGAGNIELTVDNRYTGAFIYQENAAVILHGTTESCFSYTNAKGKINFKDLIANKLVIEYGSLADTYVNVTGEIDATIYYKGNIFYKGHPLISNPTYYSSGRLISKP